MYYGVHLRDATGDAATTAIYANVIGANAPAIVSGRRLNFGTNAAKIVRSFQVLSKDESARSQTRAAWQMPLTRGWVH